MPSSHFVCVRSRACVCVWWQTIQQPLSSPCGEPQTLTTWSQGTSSVWTEGRYFACWLVPLGFANITVRSVQAWPTGVLHFFGPFFHFFRGELIKVKLCLCKLQNLNQNMKILNKFTNCWDYNNILIKSFYLFIKRMQSYVKLWGKLPNYGY